MRSATLLIFLLATLVANSQTKESQFAKIEALLNKAKGFTLPNFKLGTQVFSEKKASIEGQADGTNDRMEYSQVDWDEFDFYVQAVDGEGGLSEIVVILKQEATVSSFSNGKLVDKSEFDELNFFCKTEDARAVQNYLEELKPYTWKSLIPLRTADQSGLIRYLTDKLNVALEYEDGEIKSINACEVTIQFSNEGETVIPTKIVNIHDDDEDSDYMVFCYGKNEARIKMRETGGWNYESVEHPEILLDFEGNESEALAVKYALRRLARFCKE